MLLGPFELVLAHCWDYSLFVQCSLSYWVILILQYHAYLIPSPLPSNTINPPEPRWLDATVHRISHCLECVVIIDWECVAQYIWSADTNINHYSFCSIMHLGSSGSRQRKAFEYPMTWIHFWLKHPRLCDLPLKSSVGKSHVDARAEKRPRHPPAEITASPRAPSWQQRGKKNLSTFKFKIRGF